MRLRGTIASAGVVWPAVAGPAVLRLRRLTSRGACGLASVGIITLLIEVLTGGEPFQTRVAGLTLVLVGLAVVIRGTLRWLTPGSVLGVLALALGAFVLPDITASSLSFAGGLLMGTFLLASMTTLRPVPSVVMTSSGLSLGVVVQWIHAGTTTMAPVDLAVLLMGIATAGSVFMPLLIKQATALDEASAGALRDELELTKARSHDAAALTVQRVLHDDVIAALRVIIDYGDLDITAAQRAAARACAAIAELEQQGSR